VYICLMHGRGFLSLACVALRRPCEYANKVRSQIIWFDGGGGQEKQERAREKEKVFVFACMEMSREGGSCAIFPAKFTKHESLLDCDGY